MFAVREADKKNPEGGGGGLAQTHMCVLVFSPGSLYLSMFFFRIANSLSY